MTLPNEIVRRRPANEVETRRITVPRPLTTMLMAPTAKGVLAELAHRQRRGGIASVGQLRLITMGAHAGQYGIPVVLRPVRRDPIWATVLVRVGWVIFSLALLAGSLAWLVQAMTPAAVAGVCAVVLALLAARVKLAHRRSHANVVNINIAQR